MGYFPCLIGFIPQTILKRFKTFASESSQDESFDVLYVHTVQTRQCHMITLLMVLCHWNKLDSIRVTYSGLLGFAVAMGGILAGLAFIIIVTRQLTPEEFGVWAVIGSMASYSATAEPIISYWTTRQVARGKPVGRTSMASTSLFAGGSIPIYIVSVLLFANIETAFLDSMILGAILIPVTFLRGTLSAINLGHKPHAVSIGMAVFQSVKIPAGLGLVFFLGLGLDGAILTVFAAYLVDIAVQMRHARPKLAVLLDFSYLKGWIRQSWIPLYGRIPGVLASLDVIIYTIIVGSIVGVAYYAAAAAVAGIVGRAGRISQALYPKLLAEGSRNYISENFTWVMYFAIPLLVVAAIFSRHAMFLLNPEYVGAWFAAILLAFNALVRVLIIFFRQVLMGTDTVDADESPRVSALLKSRLFLVGTIANVHHALYLGVLVVSLFAFNDMSDLDLVAVWSAVFLAVSAPFVIYYGILVRRHAPFRVQFSAILRYLAGGAGIAAVFILTNEHIVEFEVSIYSYVPGLLLELLLCCAAYLGITYAIDYKTRRLFKLVLLEISRRKDVKG